ncbi:DnaJ-like protein [Cladobotryum mycophilum]|uniref:DnaJ-like protein n=1 Tax=Cladobotryum mycophilum TaxID=491253 RepID=A0ABR0SDK2_9HYPO
MKLFSSSKKPASKKNASGSSLDESEEAQTQNPNNNPEPSAPTTKSSSTSPNRKPSRPLSYRDVKSSSSTKSRLSRHSTDPGSSSRRSAKFDPDTHPLNLPPEERKRLSELSTAAMSNRNSMDVDKEPVNGAASPPPAKSTASAQKNFAVPIPNGMNHDEDAAPPPPPHKSNPSSPIPTTLEDAEIYKTAGNRYFKEKNYAKAVEQYSKAVDLFPNSALYLGNRAAAYMSSGNYEAALDDCTRATDIDPQNAKVLLRLARIYTGLGRPDEAMTTFNRIHPPPSAKDMSSAKEMLHHIKSARDSLHRGTAMSMVLHALDQAERGLGPGVARPRKWQLMRGEAYLKMGRENSLGEAQGIAMSLLRSNSQDPEALVLRGRVLYGQGDNEKAMQYFRMACSCDPDYRDAIKWLRIVQKLDRMKEEGNADFKAGRIQAAIQKYTDALAIDPTNKSMSAKLLQNRAQCNIKLKLYDEAIKDSERAFSLDPSYTKARKTKANALGLSGKWEESVNEWKSIQELDPEDRTVPKEVRKAELELKKSQRKDYYKIMGLEKDADANDIKRAYRKMAVKLHPDKNPGDAEAEAKFKDMQEAYETLSDPQKRARYDNGDDLLDPSDMFSSGGMGGGMGGIDPEILFSMMGNQGGFGGGGGFRSAGGFPGGAGGFPGGAGGFNFGGHADDEEDETEDGKDSESNAEPDGSSSRKHHHASSSKLQDDFQQHRVTRDELVDSMRRYGLWLLAALVLLPLPLVALGLIGMAFVYTCMKYSVQRRGRNSTTG